MDGAWPAGASQAGRDRFAKFNDALSDVEAIHRTAKLNAAEEETRERLRQEVEKMILPVSIYLTRFIGLPLMVFNRAMESF